MEEANSKEKEEKGKKVRSLSDDMESLDNDGRKNVQHLLPVVVIQNV